MLEKIVLNAILHIPKVDPRSNGNKKNKPFTKVTLKIGMSYVIIDEELFINFF